jgi:hypothetical protein
MKNRIGYKAIVVSGIPFSYTNIPLLIIGQKDEEYLIYHPDGGWTINFCLSKDRIKEYQVPDSFILNNVRIWCVNSRNIIRYEI